jgi:hypothetical protein
MKLLINQTLNLQDFFIVPPDETKWEPMEYILSGNKHKVLVPNRDRATFSSINNALISKSEYSNNLKNDLGIYLLSFDVPYRAFYVGVAGNGAKGKPEGVLKRISKHRIKVTASNVGVSVNHTKKWREFAFDRYQYFLDKKMKDSCLDMRFNIGKIESGVTQTEMLEFFEHQILHNINDVRSRIYDLLWPNNMINDVKMLTAASKKGYLPDDPEIYLWDGSQFRF